MEDGVYENEVLPPFGSEPEPTGGEPPEEPTEAGAEPATEPAEPEPTGDEPPAEPQSEEDKAKGVQKRFDELTRKRREAEREAEYWKAKATQGQQQPEPQAQPEPVIPGFPAKPTVDQFESYEDFVEALTDWKTDLKLTRRDYEATQRQQAEQQRTVAEQHSARVDKARTAYTDFDETVAMLDGIMVPHSTISAIAESDASAELFYYLGKHPEEAKQLQTMTPAAQLKQIGRIEAKLEKKPTAETPAAQVKRVSQAPEPIKPVGGNEKANVNPDDMSDDEWLKHEQARLSKLGRLY